MDRESKKSSTMEKISSSTQRMETELAMGESRAFTKEEQSKRKKEWREEWENRNPARRKK